MRVLALGSCRIYEPLAEAQRSGEIEYLNRHFRRRYAIFLHDVHEAIQFVRLACGEIVMPKKLRPFAFERGLRLHRRLIIPFEQAECVVVEACTDEHYEAAGWTLNVNETHKLLVRDGRAAADEWWQTIDNGYRPSDALVQAVEAELRARWRTRWAFGDGHRLVLRELSFRYLPMSEIAEGLGRLQALLARPLLVVPHVAVRLPDGSHLAERLQHVEKTIEAARMIGLPFLDPQTFIARDGQSRVLDKCGTDFHHYAGDYVPVVGREIVEALRRSTRADQARW